MLILVPSTGCSLKSNEPPLVKIQKMFKEMEDYQATCVVTFISNKSSNNYRMTQYSRMTGEYRLEILEPERLKDTLTICNGEEIVQIDNRVGGKVYKAKPNIVRNLVLLNSFIQHYMQTEEVAVRASTEVENVTEMEATIPGNHPYLVTQRLSIDNETLQPIRMTILDGEGKETIVVQFEDFDYNVGLEDDLFQIPK